jgi:haloalkane dehalogenase
MLAIVGNPLMREFDALTGFLPRITASSFGIGRHLNDQDRRAFLAGMRIRGRRAFHNYMRSARRSDDLYQRSIRALTGPLAPLPLLTIFGERNDPFGFQKRWKELFPTARQEVVAGGNHFPMCDAPDFVARTISDWYSETVASRHVDFIRS